MSDCAVHELLYATTSVFERFQASPYLLLIDVTFARGFEIERYGEWPIGLAGHRCITLCDSTSLSRPTALINE